MYGDVAELDAALAGGVTAPSAVVACCPVTAAGDTPAEAAEHAAAWGLELVRHWLGDGRSTEPPLVVVTRGAAPVPGTSPTATGAAHATLVGLLRSAQAEAPGRIVLVDVADDGLPDPEVLDDGLPASADIRADRPAQARSPAGCPLRPRSKGSRPSRPRPSTVCSRRPCSTRHSPSASPRSPCATAGSTAGA